LVPKGKILQMECGSRFEGRRRGDSQHVKCAECQTAGLTEERQLHVLIQIEISDRHSPKCAYRAGR
jgi:hypothetical protein